MDHRIPVTVLTGFLGSGKTTLLNHLLRRPGMRDTAVIINELGDVGLDHILARTVQEDYIADNTVLLQSGCLCCVLRTELADTLRDLFFKRALMAIPEFGRLVIETTGLADPGPILAHLLNADAIREHYRLDAVVTTVDCTHGRQQLATCREARRQAAVADVLLLTKADLAQEHERAALAADLRTLNPGATQHLVVQGVIAPETLFCAGLLDASGRHAQPRRWLAADARHNIARHGTPAAAAHGGDVAHFTVTLPHPHTWAQLEPALRRLCATEGERLLRLKGILHASDLPCPAAVHAVHHTLYPLVPLAEFSEDPPHSRIVVIGQEMDEPAVRDALMKI